MTKISMQRRTVLMALSAVACHRAQAKGGAGRMIAAGKFDVTLTPEAGQVPGGSAMRLTKHYHGALSGTGTGVMLAAHGTVAGSGGYVAMEQVTGTLDGRAGAFILQHSGTMQAGRESLAITVVSDSGTGALVGLSGSMAIERHGGDHAYRFEYVL